MTQSTNILPSKAIIMFGLVVSITGIVLAYLYPSLGVYLLMFNLLPSICALLVLFSMQGNFDENQRVLNQQNQGILDQLKTERELIKQQQLIVENQNVEIANLKSDFIKQKQDFATINTSLENQSSKIQNHGEELLTFQANFKDQSNLISLAQAGINEQNGNNVLLKSMLKEQGVIMEVLKSDLSEFKVKQSDHETKLTGLTTSLADKDKSITTLQSEVKSNRKNLGEKAEILLQNSNNIAQQKSEINTHNSKLDVHDGNISTMQNNINDHQLELKQQQTELNSIQKSFSNQFEEMVKQQYQANNRIESINVNQSELTNKLVNQYNSLQNISTDLIEQKGALKEHTSYLKNTQEELASQRDKFVEQNSAWSHQTFDNTFFKFLESHNRMTSTMELFTSGKGQKVSLAQGKGCFTFFHKKLGKKVAEYTEYTLQNTLAAYNVFYRDYKTELEPYFKNIYQALKFVEESDIKEINKERYAHFVRAQLSAHELNLIYYHGLSMHTEEDLKIFLEKYTMFKNMDKGLLYSKSHDNEYKTKGKVQNMSEK